MLHDYSTEYTTKYSATCYDEDINSSGKPSLSFNKTIVCQVLWPNFYCGEFSIQGSHCWQGFFIL